MNSASKKLAVFAVTLVFSVIFFVIPVKSQTTLEQVSSERTQLQQQLKDLEKQITSYQSQLKTIKGQKNTLQNKIASLKKQQELLDSQIRISALQLTDINLQEIAIQKNIDLNKIKTTELRTELSRLISLMNIEDNRSFLYILLLSSSLDEAFKSRTVYDQLISQLGQKLKEKNITDTELNNNINTLEEKRRDQNNLLAIKALQQKQLADSVTEQNSILKTTKGKESAYQAQLTDKQKEVAAIKNRLYQLLEVDKQITFGQAVSIAQWASSQTGVRAAFLLAVLTQESSLGKNVGTCNRAGDPPSKSWKVVMKPERDQGPFKTITSELGLNIDTTPVSCPMKDKTGKQIGWGGAMGPAQFIPSTWMGYRAKVTAVTGKAANPWDIRDAFLAAAIKLKADGAGSQSGEWTAAMKYFSGGTNPAYRFYGDNVVATAADYASDIEKMK